jgi:hypothetical protein
MSCFVGLRDNTRLQVYNEFENTWNEFSYHRGDIFLMRSHKAHRGTNYGDQDNSKVFFYIDTPDMLHTTDLHGKVFNVRITNLRAWFYHQHSVSTTERLQLTAATKNKAALKRRRAKQNRANACRKRALSAGESIATCEEDDDAESDDDRASLEPNPEDEENDDHAPATRFNATPRSSSSSSSSSVHVQETTIDEEHGPLSQESSLRASATHVENTRRAYQAAHRQHDSQSPDNDPPSRHLRRRPKDA